MGELLIWCTSNDDGDGDGGDDVDDDVVWGADDDP